MAKMALFRSLLILAATFQAVLAFNQVDSPINVPKGIQLIALTPSPIPSQCESNCSSPVTLLQQCSPPISPCLCTTTFQTNLFNCYICLGGVQHPQNYDQAQRDLDLITSSCDAFNLTLPELTLPGENATRIISTALLPTGASTDIGAATITLASTTITAPAGAGTPSSSVTAGANGADSLGCRPFFAIFGVAVTWIVLYPF